MPLKLGIRSLSKLPRVTTLFGRRKAIDLWLYGEILQSAEEADRWLLLIIDFIAANGSYKWTENLRFEKLDVKIAEFVKDMTRSQEIPLRVHDIGVSDGRTACELFRRIRDICPVDYTASDLYPIAYIVRHMEKGWSVAFDQDGSAIQYAGWGFVVSARVPDRLPWYPVNRLVRKIFEKKFEPRAIHVLNKIDFSSLRNLEKAQDGEYCIFKIPLICRECLGIMNETNSFRFIRHDVRTQTNESYDLIRVMNVLNHLGRNDQVRALHGCFNSLRDNGYLVVGRTLGGEMPTSIWTRHGNDLSLLLDIAGGSEISHLLDKAINGHSRA
jgi:hypothetical protein